MRPLKSEVAGVVHKPNSVSALGCPATDDNHSSSGYRLPGTSCNRPGSSDGPPFDASLFGFAPDGVYPASPVTRRTGALLPHRFTLTRNQTNPFDSWRYTFCCTFLRVTATPRYGASCPMVFGLSSRRIKRPAIVWTTPTHILSL